MDDGGGAGPDGGVSSCTGSEHWSGILSSGGSAVESVDSELLEGSKVETGESVELLSDFTSLVFFLVVFLVEDFCAVSRSLATALIKAWVADLMEGLGFAPLDLPWVFFACTVTGIVEGVFGCLNKCVCLFGGSSKTKTVGVRTLS